MSESGGPGQFGHSFCANSPHLPNALCATPLIESALASPSTHELAELHPAYGGLPSVARYLLISSTHVTRAAAYGSPGSTGPLSVGGGVVSAGGGAVSLPGEPVSVPGDFVSVPPPPLVSAPPPDVSPLGAPESVVPPGVESVVGLLPPSSSPSMSMFPLTVQAVRVNAENAMAATRILEVMHRASHDRGHRQRALRARIARTRARSMRENPPNWGQLPARHVTGRHARGRSFHDRRITAERRVHDVVLREGERSRQIAFGKDSDVEDLERVHRRPCRFVDHARHRDRHGVEARITIRSRVHADHAFEGECLDP